MLKGFRNIDKEQAVPIIVLTADNFSAWEKTLNARQSNWLKVVEFRQKSGSYALLPNEAGELETVVIFVDDLADPFNLSDLATTLPAGFYYLDSEYVSPSDELNYALGWGLALYNFARYKTVEEDKSEVNLCIADREARQKVEDLISAIYLVRDLINTPTENMGPEELGKAAHDLGHSFGASVHEVIGKELLKHRYPAIHAVGRASVNAPRLIELTWGEQNKQRLTLVGKGVCFDTGGLDLKPSSAMGLMKKDMGGAAHVLGLAHMIMAAKLPINLRVLIPAVENSVSGNAYRPGDVIPTRKGLNVEIGNTDAEGRVILADALAEACAAKPHLIIDFATLTGAARVALGPDIPVYFTNNSEHAQSLNKHADAAKELIWQLPLHEGYRSSIDSNIADIKNDSSMRYGGAITAALFLQEFIDEQTPWVHFDLMAWNLSSKPGKPEGGEAMGLRAVFNFIQDWIK